MKITKLMLAALVAAAALVSCNKEDLDPENTGLKTVKISLENAIMTKGPAGDKIKSGDLVKVNDIKIFLTDENYSKAYLAQDINGNEAKTYFKELPTSSKPVEYHFIDSKCTRVLVVANLGDISFENLKTKEVEIVNQQSQTNLVLVGSKKMSLVKDDPDKEGDQSVHVHESGKYTVVYQADVKLSPIISRFEIDGFAIKFSDPVNYQSIAIKDVAFQNFYNKATYELGGFTPNDIYKPITNLKDEGSVINWITDPNNSEWYRDSFTDVTLTNISKKKNIDPKAYHFFANESIIPTMIIKVEADGQAAYVYAESYNIVGGSSSIQSLTPGMIYRMDSDGTGNGVVEIPDDFDPIERCINVSVSVEPWAVTLVEPDFNNE